MRCAAQSAQVRVVSGIGLPHRLQDNDFSAKLDSKARAFYLADAPEDHRFRGIAASSSR
jgi:hypothetical protein